MRVFSDIAPARPAACPRSSESGTWFEAPTAFGNVRLCVQPDGPAAQHAAEAAIGLRRVEPLLAALDDWTGAGLAWRWTPLAPQVVPGLALARWRGDSTTPAARVFWPWALLRSLRAPSSELAAQLDWPMVAAVLVLARLQIGLDELELLEPGGAVLVPQSMQPCWEGTLRAADEPPGASGGVAVDWSTPWRPRLAGRDAPGSACVAAVDATHAACELRLDLPLGVSAQRLSGWRRDGDAGEIVCLNEHGLRAALWRAADPGDAEQRLASGRLMPWGDGWALALESLDNA